MGIGIKATHREPWNKVKIVVQKAPFKQKEIWALRVRLQMEKRVRELALFNLGMDSKLRGSDLVDHRSRLNSSITPSPENSMASRPASRCAAL